MVFTTGRGTPIGTQIMPVIKVMANDITWQKMSDNIDLCECLSDGVIQ